MIAIIKALAAVFLIGILLGCVITMFWFCYALMVNFWKIFLKKKELQKNKECKHPSYTFTDLDPELPWTCRECGKNVK